MARTTNGGLTRIDSSPGDLTLFNTMILDAASLIAGFTNSINVAGTGETPMSQADLRAKVVSLTGLLTGARTLTWPTTECARAVIFRNASTGSFSLTIKVSGGLGVAIPQGYAQMLWHDGVNVYAAGPAMNIATGLMIPSGLFVPSARVYHNAAQSIANTTGTSLAFNSERDDSDTIHDTVTNNSRLTCRTAGKYLIHASAEFAVSAVGAVRALNLQLNGATLIATQYVTPIGGGLPTALSCSTAYRLAVNDYVEAAVYQDSGGALNVNSAGNYSPEFGMVRVGD